MARSRMTGEQRRQSIIQAATAVIARTSFERCTTAAIAKEAGVNEALIYNHFSGKKELQLAGLDNIHKSLLGWMERIDDIPATSFKEIRAQGKAFWQDSKKNPDQMTVVLKAQCVEDTQIKEKVWEVMKSLHTAWTRVLSKVVGPDRFAGVLNVEIMAWLMTAWVSNLSLLNQLGRPDEISEKQVDQFSAFLDWARETVTEQDKVK